MNSVCVIFRVHSECSRLGKVSFPRLRTIDAYPSNLPQNLSSFVGREGQLAQLLNDLRSCDLVTLTGTGGVGKTRLAVQVCAEALPRFTGGAWFVDLATIRDPEQIVVATAEVLDVKERTGEALAVTLRDYLRDREAIVLFDNGEHVVEALAGLIEQLWSREISAKFLITTREPLGIDGEQVRRVVSLDAGEGADLFVQRASSVRSDVAWATYGAEVDEICNRLDGIPLAIELAAARSRSMLPPEILARLDERFRLLSGGKRTARERHQTLLAAVEWSYELLDAGERLLFDRLAVFRGGFTLEAAEAVCSGESVDEMDVVDLLDRLVDKSMVLAHEVQGRSRYRLLETLRQFGESRLLDLGDAARYRDRHVDYYRQFVAEWHRLIPTADSQQAVAVLATESSNFEAALSWMAERDRWPEFREFCGFLKPFWTNQGLADGPRWYGLLLEHLEAFQPPDQVAILAEAGHTAINGGAHQMGRELSERSIDTAAATGCDPPFLAYLALGLAASNDGDEAASARFGALAEGTAQDLGGRWIEPDGAIMLARLMRVASDVELRRPEVEAEIPELAAFAERTGFPVMIGGVQIVQGRLASLVGDQETAERFFDSVIEIGRSQPSPQLLVTAVEWRSEGRLRAGNGEILEDVPEALEVFAQTPVAPRTVADIWTIIATVWLAEGRFEEAAVLGAAAGALLVALGVRGRQGSADIRQQLGDDLAASMSPEELDAHIAAAREMTADDVRRFIFERL